MRSYIIVALLSYTLNFHTMEHVQFVKFLYRTEKGDHIISIKLNESMLYSILVIKFSKIMFCVENVLMSDYVRNARWSSK